MPVSAAINRLVWVRAGGICSISDCSAELATRIKPGEVRNPTGRNQYTAERELFQREIGEVLATELRELSKTAQTDLRAVRRAIVEAILEKATLGEPWACQLVADRLWPRGADSAAEAASESFADLVRIARGAPPDSGSPAGMSR